MYVCVHCDVTPIPHLCHYLLFFHTSSWDWAGWQWLMYVCVHYACRPLRIYTIIFYFFTRLLGQGWRLMYVCVHCDVTPIPHLCHYLLFYYLIKFFVYKSFYLVKQGFVIQYIVFRCVGIIINFY